MHTLNLENLGTNESIIQNMIQKIPNKGMNFKPLTCIMKGIRTSRIEHLSYGRLLVQTCKDVLLTPWKTLIDSLDNDLLI